MKCTGGPDGWFKCGGGTATSGFGLWTNGIFGGGTERSRCWVIGMLGACITKLYREVVTKILMSQWTLISNSNEITTFFGIQFLILSQNDFLYVNGIELENMFWFVE